MRFRSLSIAGAAVVAIEPFVDPRGFFARTFCRDEFEAHGLPGLMVQANVSYNARRGTVRGLHFQWPPSQEGKLVRCLRGKLFDVLVDLRPESATYLEHEAVTLDEEGREAVFVPHGVAHGFQTLEDRTEVLYQMSDFYAPDLATGVRWNDPSFGIRWPLADVTLSDRDQAYPEFDRARFEADLRRARSVPRSPERGAPAR